LIETGSFICNLEVSKTQFPCASLANQQVSVTAKQYTANQP